MCLLDSARVMIGYINIMLGHDFNTTDDAELAEAAEKLKEIKPNVLARGFQPGLPVSALGRSQGSFPLYFAGRGVRAVHAWGV